MTRHVVGSGRRRELNQAWTVVIPCRLAAGDRRSTPLPAAVMLPDYVDLKQRFGKLFNRFLVSRVEHRLGPTFANVRRRRQFEGTTWSIKRPGVPEEPSGFQETAANMKLSFEEIARITLDDLLKRLDDLAEQMSREMGRRFFTSIDTTLKKHGRTVNTGGRPPSAEGILRLLEDMEISFERGDHGIELHVHPDALADAQKASDDLVTDPALNRRFRDLMSRKWEEWRARESDRGLDG
jgi:predicted transcriptional regulator